MMVTVRTASPPGVNAAGASMVVVPDEAHTSIVCVVRVVGITGLR
jgi:hypothetical protein